MKTKAICSFFVLFAIAGGVTAMPSAFAAEVSVPEGSGVPGCEETDECWFPSVLTVAVGETVTWSNDDTAAHTVTSGTAADGPDGAFDSSLFMAGASFEATFDEAGTFVYFCMVHPWMVGTVIVGEAMAEEAMDDVELMVTITDSIMDDGTHVYLEFSEIHVNYEITAMQNGETILQETSHSMEMTGEDYHIDAVGSDESPIVIEVVSLPGEGDIDWNGPTGIVATSQVVPEFGTIAMMILAVAIISIVAVTTKSRVIPRF